MGNKKSTKSLLRWAGSKKQSAAKIIKYLDFDNKYIEPFCGSCTFFFSNNPSEAYFNDSNASLISFYNELANDVEGLWRAYNKIPITEASYYASREKFNSTNNMKKKAALFLYLNHYCFNGIYRTNSKGKFNTPFGARVKIREKSTLEELMFFSAMVKRANFYSLDFEEFLEKLNPINSCIYMDPPYFTKDERVFNEYGEKYFMGKDLQRLFEITKWLEKNGNKIIISYKNCTEFQDLFSDKIVSEIDVTRNVGGFSGRRKVDTELIAVI